jgi:hypothetical protein
MSEFVSDGSLGEWIVQQRSRDHEDIPPLCEPEESVMFRLHSFLTQETEFERPAFPLGRIGPVHLRGIESPCRYNLTRYSLALRGSDFGIRRHDLQKVLLAQLTVGRSLTVGANGEQHP